MQYVTHTIRDFFFVHLLFALNFISHKNSQNHINTFASKIRNKKKRNINAKRTFNEFHIIMLSKHIVL